MRSGSPAGNRGWAGFPRRRGLRCWGRRGIFRTAPISTTWWCRPSGAGVWWAIRQIEMYTEALGVATWRYKLLAFVASALYAGSAGALYAHYVGFINPTPFSVDASMNAILAVIL